MDKKLIAFLIAIIMIVGGLVTFVLFFGKAKNNEYLKMANGGVINVTTNELSKNETNSSTKTSSKDEDDEKNTTKKSSSDDETNTSKKSTSKDEEMAMIDELDKQVFNAQFEMFKGDSTGKTVLKLINALDENNKENKDDKNKIPVVLYVEESGECFEYTNDLDKLKDKIDSDHRYHITEAYNEDSDLIHCVVITYDMKDDIKNQIEDLAKEFAGN